MDTKVQLAIWTIEDGQQKLYISGEKSSSLQKGQVPIYDHVFM